MAEGRHPNHSINSDGNYDYSLSAKTEKFYNKTINLQHIITKNHRMTVSHVENRAWVLRIKDVKESDKGWYMCQVRLPVFKRHVKVD